MELPKELSKDIKEALSNDTTMAFYREDVWCLFIKTFAAGVKAGLMEAREMMPETKIQNWNPRAVWEDKDEENRFIGWNDYHNTLRDCLDKKINSLK